MTEQITQWSFSRLKDYRQCPAKAKFKHILRLKEPGNAAMQRGTDAHALAESFARASLKAKAPVELAKLEKEFRKLQKEGIITEEKWALTKDWVPTGFFDKNCWVRVVLDCAFIDDATETLHIIDYKTGKVYEDSKEQLSLYAVAGFEHYPDVKHVSAELWYLDTGEIIKLEYDKSQLPAIKKEWKLKTRAMLNDKTFAPRAGSYCRWCHYRKTNGGPCEF